jgi:hypothetical protein
LPSRRLGVGEGYGPFRWGNPDSLAFLAVLLNSPDSWTKVLVVTVPVAFPVFGKEYGMKLFVSVALCLCAWPLLAQDRFDSEIQQEKDAKKKAAEELRESRSITIPADVLAMMQDRDWGGYRNPTVAQARGAEAVGVYLGKGKLTKIYFPPTANSAKFFRNMKQGGKETIGFANIVVTSPDGKQHETHVGISGDDRDRVYVVKVIKQFAPKGIDFSSGKAAPIK